MKNIAEGKEIKDSLHEEIIVILKINTIDTEPRQNIK